MPNTALLCINREEVRILKSSKTTVLRVSNDFIKVLDKIIELSHNHKSKKEVLNEMAEFYYSYLLSHTYDIELAPMTRILVMDAFDASLNKQVTMSNELIDRLKESIKEDLREILKEEGIKYVR